MTHHWSNLSSYCQWSNCTLTESNIRFKKAWVVVSNRKPKLVRFYFLHNTLSWKVIGNKEEWSRSCIMRGLFTTISKCLLMGRPYWSGLRIGDFEKQPYRGVLRKRCFENMQQFTGEHPFGKGILINKVATLLKSHFGMGVPLKFTTYFQNTFS